MSQREGIYQRLAEAIATHIAAQCPIDSTNVVSLLEKPRNRQFGDIAFPCFQLAKLQKKSPVQCAQELAQSLPLPEGIVHVRADGPFLNFGFDRAQWTATVLEQPAPKMLAQRAQAPVIVEYSSPNIAKPFHVGHLRATLIGNCLDRVYRFLGYPTISINHLGDWGTQFGFVWAGCEIWGKPGDSSVLGLLEIYRKATALKSAQEEKGEVPAEEPDITAMARQYFLDLEAGKEYAKQFWQWCSDISLAYFKRTYERLNVEFDHYTGESFYSEMLDDVHQWLREGGILSESEQALGVDLGELGFARVSTADGRSLYLTRDIATARYRAETFGFERAVYVVGAPQTLHFQQLVEILRRMKQSYADSIIHVPFGHVLGIRTRGEGDFFELNTFLDEAQDRARTAYREQVTKRPDGLDEDAVAEAVGLSAIVFGNLSRTAIKDVHFDWESALALQGDSGPYVLYAYARISGIEERALQGAVNSENVPAVADPELAFGAESGFLLAEQIDEFIPTLQNTLRDHEPSHLASYTLELAKGVSRAYLDLKVVGEPAHIAAARLALFQRAKQVLGHCIDLLGMTRIERM